MPSNLQSLLLSSQTFRAFSGNSRGSGDQAATMNIMDFLREEQFQGTIEFIYSNEIKKRICFLFNLPENIPSRYFDPAQKIVFIEMNNYYQLLLADKVSNITLAFSGSSCTGPSWLAVDASGLPQEDQVNMASFARAEVFLCFSPYIGNGYDTRLSFRNPPEMLEQLHSGKKFLHAPFVNITMTKKYLQEDLSGQMFLKKNPALLDFISGMEKNFFNVMNWYGYTLNFEFEYTNNPSNIFQLLLGARYAQLSNIPVLQKRLVIAVYYNYTQAINFLNNALFHDQWNHRLEKLNYADLRNETLQSNLIHLGLNKLKQLIRELDLANNFFTGHLSDPDIMQKIYALKEGQIMVLSMGGDFPQKVMHGMYTYPTEFPPVREGAASLTVLAKTGRPHLRCETNWELGTDNMEPELLTWFSKLYDKICSYDYSNNGQWSPDYDAVPLIGKFIIDSQNKTSPLVKYFLRVKEEAENPNNRNYYGFKRSEELLNQRQYTPRFFSSIPNHEVDVHHPYSVSPNAITNDLSVVVSIATMGTFLCTGLLALKFINNFFGRRKKIPAQQKVVTDTLSFVMNKV